MPAHPRIDWVCISPKAGTDVVQQEGDELKLVWPQAGIDPAALEEWRFRHHLIQPLDDARGQANVAAAMALAAVSFTLAALVWRTLPETLQRPDRAPVPIAPTE